MKRINLLARCGRTQHDELKIDDVTIAADEKHSVRPTTTFADDVYISDLGLEIDDS